jgi:hypothetical protein
MSRDHHPDFAFRMRCPPRCYAPARSVSADPLFQVAKSDAVLIALSMMVATATFLAVYLGWSVS